MLQTTQLDRLLELEREEAMCRARERMLPFVQYNMPHYQVNWHHRTISRALDKFIANDIPRLIVTLPPRAGKSELVSRQMPALMLGKNPDLEIMTASYGAHLAERLSRASQRIITSEPYKTLFPQTRLAEHGVAPIVPGTWLRTGRIFEVVGRRGRLQCAGIGGAFTGEGADVAIIDDPFKNMADATSQVKRDACWEWYTSTLRTRLSNTGRICVAMTRWHQDDLVGRLIAQMRSDPDADQWVVINISALFEPGADDNHPDDPRTQADEAYWSDRFSTASLCKQRAANLRVFVSLYQGKPAPSEGNVKRAWWKFYRRAELPAQLQNHTMSCDLTFKDKEKSDYNALGVFAEAGAKKYMLDLVEKRMPFTEQCRIFEALTIKHPQVRKKLVEDAANGAALIDTMSRRIGGIVPVPVHGSKIARAEAASTYIEAGDIYLPHPDECTWTQRVIEQWAVFPNGTDDDIVDCMSQYINHVCNRPTLAGFSVGTVTKKSLW